MPTTATKSTTATKPARKTRTRRTTAKKTPVAKAVKFSTEKTKPVEKVEKVKLPTSTTYKSGKVVSKTIIKPSAEILPLSVYRQDIANRWNVHHYEMQELVKDIRKGLDLVSPYNAQMVKTVKAWTVLCLDPVQLRSSSPNHTCVRLRCKCKMLSGIAGTGQGATPAFQSMRKDLHPSDSTATESLKSNPLGTSS